MTDALYHYDDRIPRRIEKFFAEWLCHTQAPFTGQPFILLPWQKEIIEDIYGTLKADGTRRYNTVYIEIPKKQGKSHLLAGLCIYELLFGDFGGQIIAVANSREQARILFGFVSDMVESSPKARKLLKSLKNAIYNPKNRSLCRVLSSDAAKANGYGGSFVVFDELADAPSGDLYNALKSGQVARNSSLMVSITTAGSNVGSFCYDLHEHAVGVEEGTISDDAFYGKIYGIKKGEDWKDEEVWKRCLPSLGFTTKIEKIREEFQRALTLSIYERAFKTYFLNSWLSSDKTWITDEEWMSCLDERLKIEDFKGESCYAAIDLSSTQDLTALSLCFFREGRFYLFPYAFCPEEGIKVRSRRDKVGYQMWADAGFLISTPGNVCDYDYIIQTIKTLSESYNIVEISTDKWNSTMLDTKLMENGFKVTNFRQSFNSMTVPIRAFERLVLGKNIVHNGHPILRWCMGNVILKIGAAGGAMTNKGKSTGRIDCVVASLMALERCSANTAEASDMIITFSG